MLEDLKAKFLEYTRQFHSNDCFVQKHFNVKKEHTFRVCENIVDIGRKIGLENEDIKLAELIALFHDIGRFEQYRKYQTFSDAESENHSDLGIHAINKNNIFEGIDENTRNFVFQVIRHHNIPYLPAGLNKKLEMFSKLIRDADKLDIYKVIIDYDLENPMINNALSDKYLISDEIYSAFVKRHIVELENARSGFDYFLLRISWIFDINFQPTFNSLNQRKYIGQLFKRIPGSYRLCSIQDIVKEYFMERIFSYA